MAPEDSTANALHGYFAEWQQIADRMLGQKAALQKAMEPILVEQARWRELLQSLPFPDLSDLSNQVLVLQKTIDRVLTPAFKQLQTTFRELPPRTQEALLTLASHGWYCDLDMSLSDLWQLTKALSDGNVQDAEAALADHFDNRIDGIEAYIAQKFPKRHKLIRAALDAHRRAEYELSIPVLLAQTDGICKEVANEYLFMRHHKRPAIATYVEQMAVDSFARALLSPLAATLPIGASEHERDEASTQLNRHMVLHGQSVEYGTKINSLKAVSLINYVAHVLSPQSQDNTFQVLK